MIPRRVDQVTILVRGGDGGRGCDARTRLPKKKFVSTGGEGGRGGNVILRADRNVTSLKGFLYQRRFISESGSPGGSNNKRGKRGSDRVISVPCGTMVFEKEKHFLIRDLVRAGEEVVVVEGGRGGVGNEGGKEARRGEPGKSLEIVLSLKIPAEVFLVGLPNCGKSKFLSRVTHARSKEEAYPFSTKHPQLGVFEAPDFERISLCELPGLYRESFQGGGAGVDFLKHLDRGKLLLLMLDPVNRFAPSLQTGYELLLEILGTYQRSFLEMPRAVVVNKMDLREAGERVSQEQFRPPDPLFLISAETGQGIEALMRFVTQKLKELSHV